MRILLLCLLPIFSTFAFEQDPTAELSLLISSTEDLLAKQKTLRALVIEYTLLHDAYLLDMDDKELLLKTAKTAKKIQTIIKEEKMAPLFDPSFISELTLFAKLANNPSIPKP